MPSNITEQIRETALAILRGNPNGLRFTELRKQIQAQLESKTNTINSAIWNLDETYPTEISKPSRGIFLYRTNTDQESVPSLTAALPLPPNKLKEEDFYNPFADWLKNDIEDVTHAIPLGGNLFKDKWGTPDIIGKKESRPSDVIKGTTQIVSAEIKTDTNQLITAFGQACAYKLFSHKVYLVVPSQSADDDISRLDSLCQIFGIGLVTFDVTNAENPDFRILVRASGHEPDLFYTNKNVARIEKELFP